MEQVPHSDTFDSGDGRGLAILGSTGSIGTQALGVVRAHPGQFRIEVLTAGNNADLLIKQALEFKPNAVALADVTQGQKVKDALWDHDIKTYAGQDAIAQLVEMDGIDIVLTALVGFAGLRPTMNAIAAGKHIALANKEALVVAGEVVMRAARDQGVDILPVDSEHSAIFQCLAGEFHNPVEKLILTASGGPFRGRNRDSLTGVTKEQALKHPNWDMGAKITIDSASLMNKGLEVIEAHWLFNVKASDIDVVVHPQSIVHSCVQFEDGSIKAQMGLPDMKLPIQYALGYPRRLVNDFPRFDFTAFPNLTFEKPDKQTFRNLQLAYDALEAGGSAPCVLNAANEVAVAAFLGDKVGFLEMSDVLEHTLGAVTPVANPDLEQLFELDREAREAAADRVRRS